MTGLHVAHLPRTLIIRNTDFNYSKYYNLEIKGKLIHEICHDSIAIYNLPIHQLLGK